MRAHRNTLLAMRLSTVLMSISALALVVLLLTSNVMAQQNRDRELRAVINAPAPVMAQPSKQIAIVAATKTLAVRPNPIVPTAVKRAAAIASKPAKSPARIVQRKAVGTNSDLPAMPQLAAIPDMPNVPAPVAHSGGGGGGSAGGGGTHASAPPPQPKPQPQVATHHS